MRILPVRSRSPAEKARTGEGGTLKPFLKINCAFVISGRCADGVYDAFKPFMMQLQNGECYMGRPSKGARRAITARLSPETYLALVEKCIEASTPLADGIEAAVESWVGKRRPVPIEPSGPAPSPEFVCVAKEVVQAAPKKGEARDVLLAAEQRVGVQSVIDKVPFGYQGVRAQPKPERKR